MDSDSIFGFIVFLDLTSLSLSIAFLKDFLLYCT